MKIAFITCHNIKNYGSVLQTYAMQTILEKMNYSVEVIDYVRPGTDDKELLNTRAGLSRLSKIPVVSCIFKMVLYPSVHKTIKVFRGFLNKYVHLTERQYHSNEELKRNIPKADIYITGSDQVWNSHINKGIEYPYFLDFVPSNKPKISFAASFGVAELKDDEKPIIKSLLERYNCISVRESGALKILEDLGIHNGKHVFDPTLLLNKDEWLKIVDVSKVPKEKYVFVYQLRANPKFDKYVVDFAREKNIKIMRINYYYHNAIKNKGCITCPTPNEMLGLLSRAEYVLTDSFHATVFSILMNKQFKTILPDFFTGRIQSILQKVGLSDRILTSFNDFSSIDKNINFEQVNKIVEKERKDTISWVDDALKSVQ